MAPEGTARPGALSLPGMRNSALASAALTSVALLAQTAGATPSLADESPSREEVSRRINSLYDRAESDTGTFNATRASSTGPRKRAAAPRSAGEDSGRGDPALNDVTRQWFDVARAKLGPTVPAALPSDRTPDRPAQRRPARATADLDRAREPGRPALELPAGPGATAAPMAELTARPIAALPPAPEARSADLQATQVLPAIPEAPQTASWATQAFPAVPALPAATAAPAPAAAEPATTPQQRSGLRTAKEQNQRKLDRARELLSLYATRLSDPLTSPAATLPAAGTWSAAQPAQAQPSAEAQWQALQAQSAADLTTVPPGASVWPTAAPAPAPAPDPLTAPFADLLTAPAVGGAPAAAPATAATLASTASQDTRAVRALEFARAQLGKPCVSGTTGPEAFDGPGLTQAAWKSAGIALPRTAQEQATAGQGVALAYLEPGDLVLFHAGHVGIYSGNGMMIHAPGPGVAIREESIHYAGEQAIHSAIRPA
ncbi:C40 family peptidase [Streptomyces lanatus]|uniref:C40 family peptidase n=1 Tax=Streptomyces lanatus TaxID=66900 RepID=A0ABV1XTZ4_9ACTN|nr:C40 family peptidase [Streptomyces lanatus]GHH11040.1 hypothetical protein GCM10018780_48220 [Streptomyces lanatus]